MRLVQVMIPAGKQRTILGKLDELEVDYAVTDETSGREFTAVVTFPLPTNAVEEVLAELREVGIDEDTYTVIVDAETVISRRFERLKKEYEGRSGDEARIAREELRTKATAFSSSLSTYVIMTVVSAVIATAGLLLDSATIVVGSMVIAPLIGPALAASVGTVLDDKELFKRGVKLQMLGIGLSIASATVFAAIVRFTHLVPPGLDPLSLGQVAERQEPNFLALAVALGAGVAGILSLTTGVSTALVGVMIAVALIPPAATVGIGLAYGIPSLAIGSLVFVLVNVLSINFAALVVLWYSGYRPQRWFRTDEARSAVVKQVAVIVVAMAMLSLFLGGVTYGAYSASTSEQEITQSVEGALSDPTYVGLSMIDVEIERTEQMFVRSPERVIVTVAVADGVLFEGLADRIANRIQADTGYDVEVEVRYIRTDQTDRG